MTEVAVCRLCNQTEEWHVDHGVKHAFSVDSTRFKLAEPKQAKVTLPGDPILRMILVRKGLITPEELGEVERELQSAGIITHPNATLNATPNGLGQSGGDSEPVSPSRSRNAERGMRSDSARGSAKGGAAKES